MAEKEFKEIQRSLSRHETVANTVERLRDMITLLDVSISPVDVVIRLQDPRRSYTLDKTYASTAGLTGEDLRGLLEDKLKTAEARLKEIEARLEAVTLLLR
jgi:hypothetical protein